MCVFLYSRMPAELCETGFWLGNVTARHQSRTDSGDQTLMWHPPHSTDPQGSPEPHLLWLMKTAANTHRHTHSQTDGGADSHSMIEKHLRGPDSIILALKRSTDDSVVALCHYDEKHDVCDASSFIYNITRLNANILLSDTHVYKCIWWQQNHSFYQQEHLNDCYWQLNPFYFS